MSSLAIASPNIALIKYWGKIDPQSPDEINIGLNPSLSMTLSQAQTKCEFTLGGDKTKILINNKEASVRDKHKVTEHVHRVAKFFSKDIRTFQVSSSNNFPQGVGLASSASAFCALTLAVLSELVGHKEAQTYLKDSEKNKILSRLARLGSGSACRSTWGGFMYWDGPFALPFHHSQKIYDTILILSKDHKKVSSREGHQLALTSPLFPIRLERLKQRTERLKEGLLKKDIRIWGPILEEEALEMHEISETSTPPVHYRSPESQQIIDIVQSLESRNFYFTLDAGPNIHFLSEKPIKPILEELLKGTNITAELWEDWTGTGPVLVSE